MMPLGFGALRMACAFEAAPLTGQTLSTEVRAVWVLGKGLDQRAGRAVCS